MKKIILILSATVLFVACKQKNLTNAASLQQQLDSIKQTQQTMPVETYTTRTITRPVYRTRTVYRSYPARTTVVQRHGMRRSTKNALIGAGVGAVSGALIGGDHHRVKG